MTELKTQEEKLAFEKDWDSHVVPSPGTGGIRNPTCQCHGPQQSIIGTKKKES